jgi:HSP20 family molecular chaperone IbpA
VQSRLENELNSTISEHSRYKSTKEDKIGDPFYQVSKVDAQIEDSGKEYIVKVPVPEYERENVHLTAKDRELSIAISRRFGEDIKTGTGDVYRSKKSENFSRIIPVKDIVDSAKVTQAYENGILSFKVAKK